MRIIAGKLKGIKLFMPINKKTRPLKDLTRESIFNLLIHSKKISFRLDESNVLDLYAGIGSFGLESISREVKSVNFVENEKTAIDVLKKNIKKLKVEKKTKIFFEDIFKFIDNQILPNYKFDLIFCDPPYKDKNIEKLIDLIYNKKILSKNGIIILHRNKINKEKLPDYFQIVEERIYGISKIIFGKF